MQVMVNQPWFSMVFTVAAFLISNLLAYGIFRWQFQAGRLFWARKTRIVRLPTKSASIQGHPEKGLTVSRVVLWNEGLKAISTSGAASIDPLRISAGVNCPILSARIIKQNDPSKPVHLELNGNSEAVIRFEALKHHGGALVELVHRGDEVLLMGRLKEGSIFERSLDMDYLDDIPFLVLWFWVKQPLRRVLRIGFFSLCMLFLALALPVFLFNLDSTGGLLRAIMVRARAIFILVVYLGCMWQIWRMNGAPNGLSDFYERINFKSG